MQLHLNETEVKQAIAEYVTRNNNRPVDVKDVDITPYAEEYGASINIPVVQKPKSRMCKIHGDIGTCTSCPQCGNAYPKYHEIMGSPAEHFAHVHTIVLHCECAACERRFTCELNLAGDEPAKVLS